MPVRLLLFEYLTGGGLWLDGPAAPPDSWLVEGRAMITALAADFAAAGHDVQLLVDARVDLPLSGVHVHRVGSGEELWSTFRCETRKADWTLIVAPETGGRLFCIAQGMKQAGGRLLTPPPAAIELAADKHRLAEHLRSVGVAAPRGVLVRAGESWPRKVELPAVIKPCDGAGSVGVQIISTCEALEPATGDMRLEEFVDGLSVSAALLCGPPGVIALPPCTQTLVGDTHIQYCGGTLPLAPELARRAQELACRAVATLPPCRGYLGVDLVLGASPSGADDTVIEINPRLTTSYLGLRRACRTNLAQAMLDVAHAKPIQLEFADEPLEFTSAGLVRYTCQRESADRCASTT